MELKIYPLVSISLIRFLSLFFFFNFVVLFLCRAVNTCYRVLVEHGPAYREWVWGAGPPEKREHVLRILRAGTELLRYFDATPGSSAFLARLTDKVEECVEDMKFSTMQRELHLEEAAAEANRRAEDAERRNGELQARHQALERAVREGEGRADSLRTENRRLRGAFAALRQSTETFVARLLLEDTRVPARVRRGAQRIRSLLSHLAAE